jgi:hypothetical protein
LVVYCFTSHSRIFHLYGDVTITGEGLQNLGLCSALRAFEQGGIFIVPHLLRHGASVFPVSSEGPPHSVASYDTQGDVENLFLPGFSRVPYHSPLTTHKGMWRIYSNPDPRHQKDSLLNEVYNVVIRLIDYLLFYVPLKNISLIWRRHHCRWRAAKFWPMLGAFEQGGIFNVPHLL